MSKGHSMPKDTLYHESTGANEPGTVFIFITDSADKTLQLWGDDEGRKC